MLGNILKWIVTRAAELIPQDIEKGIAAVVETGAFAAQISRLAAGQSVTSPAISEDFGGHSYKVTVTFEKTA